MSLILKTTTDADAATVREVFSRLRDRPLARAIEEGLARTTGAGEHARRGCHLRKSCRANRLRFDLEPEAFPGAGKVAEALGRLR
jgi:hypothetical protein